MKKIFSILLSIAILVSLFVLPAFSQKNKRNKISKKTQKVSVKKSKIIKPKILSLGVINGRALNLVQPKYPRAAKYLGVHGAVQVSILIDENGDVIEAKGIKGNLFLIPNSIIAAKESKFEPFKLSNGNAVKINGIIVYNYTPTKLNWFELGFYSGQLEKLKEYLPEDFESEKQLIDQYENADFYARKQIYESLIASIESRLISDEKNFWLFNVGVCVKNFTKESQNQLENLIFTAPKNISSNIKDRLEKILEFSKQNDQTKLNLAMQNLTENSFLFGN